MKNMDQGTLLENGDNQSLSFSNATLHIACSIILPSIILITQRLRSYAHAGQTVLYLKFWKLNFRMTKQSKKQLSV